MIAANELRIGNYLNILVKNEDFGTVGAKIPFRIKNGKHIDTVTKKSKADQEDIVEAIPLTPEILEKAGFFLVNPISHRWKKYINEVDSECIGLQLAEVGNNTSYRVLYDYNAQTYLKQKVERLHQLQNLYYSLTGTELIISL